MKIEISSFSDVGNFSKERIGLKVLSDVDIGDYMVLCSAASSKGGPVAGRKGAFWFPDGEIEAGDRVILYTKSGKTSKKDLSDGSKAHFYYWGLDSTVWGGTGNVAVLLLISDWISKGK